MSVTIISQVLQDCYESLVDGFYSATLVARLYSQKCINTEEMEQVESGATNMDRSRKLLKILRTKTNSVLDTLLEFFHSDGTQTHFEELIYESATKFGYYDNGIGGPSQAKRSRVQMLPSKWWPEHKEMIKTFVNRSIDDGSVLVDHLRAQLLSSNCQTAAIVAKKHAIVGMGGIGKTSTAKWYANSYQDEYDHIIWIDSEGQSLSNSWTQLAKKLNLTHEPGKGLKELVKLIYEKFDGVSCLFVFDNAERYDGENGLKSLLPRHELHHSLITSRNQDWGNPTEFGRISTIQLDIFTETECNSLFSTALALVGRTVDERDVLALGMELGFLPLALQCAVASITKSKRYTGASYLERIRQDLQILVDKRILNEYERSISATLCISLEQIEQDEEIEVECRELCQTILTVAAYCEPNEIPEDLFLGFSNVNKHNLSDAVDQLVLYSLVTVEHDGREEECCEWRTLGLHRLMQHVIRCQTRQNPDRSTTTLQLALTCMQSDSAPHHRHAFHIWATTSQQFDDFLLTNFGYPYERSLSVRSFSPDMINRAIKVMTSSKIFKSTDLAVLQLQMRLIEILVERNDSHEAMRVYDALSKLLNGENAINFKQELDLQLQILWLSIRDVRLAKKSTIEQEEILEVYRNVVPNVSKAKYNGTIEGMQFHCPTEYTKGLGLGLALVFRYGLALFASGQLDRAIDVINLELQNMQDQQPNEKLDLSLVVRVEKALLNGNRGNQYTKLLDGVAPKLYQLLRSSLNNSIVTKRPESQAHAAVDTIGRIAVSYGKWLVSHKLWMGDMVEVLELLLSVPWDPKNRSGLVTLEAFVLLVNQVLKIAVLSTSTGDQQETIEDIINLLDSAWKRLNTALSTSMNVKDSREVYWTWLPSLGATYSYALLLAGKLKAALELDAALLALLPTNSNLPLEWVRLYKTRSLGGHTLKIKHFVKLETNGRCSFLSESDMMQIWQSKLKLASRVVELSMEYEQEWALITTCDDVCSLHILRNELEEASEMWRTSFQLFSEFARPKLIASIGRQALELLEHNQSWATLQLCMDSLAAWVDSVIESVSRTGGVKVRSHAREFAQLIARLFRHGHHKTATRLASCAEYYKDAFPQGDTNDARRFIEMKALVPVLTLWSDSHDDHGRCFKVEATDEMMEQILTKLAKLYTRKPKHNGEDCDSESSSDDE